MREREREREIKRERERECERERVSERERVRERESVCVCVCVCNGMCVCCVGREGGSVYCLAWILTQSNYMYKLCSDWLECSLVCVCACRAKYPKPLQSSYIIGLEQSPSGSLIILK